jgi:hypothetical protein
MDLGTEILKGAVTLVVALTGAFMGVLLALQKHRREKQWEARYSSYQDILRAISDIHTWVEEAYASARMLPALNSEKLSELSTQFHAARLSLWRYAKVGNLTISSASLAALEALLYDLENERFRIENEPIDDTNFDDLMSEHCEKLRALLDKHIPEIMRVAKADLK